MGKLCLFDQVNKVFNCLIKFVCSGNNRHKSLIKKKTVGMENYEANKQAADVR